MATNVETLIRKDFDLPLMPEVARKVLERVAHPETTPAQLQEIIETDPALTARILKMANSPFYGIPRTVRTLSTAIMILGFRCLRNLVVAATARGLYRVQSPLERMLWEHAMGVAVAARVLAREVHFPDPEEAFLGGLFHDVGKLLFLHRFPQEYPELIDRAYQEGEEPDEVERAFFGFAHPDVGSILIRTWQLSEELELSVRYHHAFHLILEGYPFYIGKLTILLFLGDRTCRALGIGTPRPMGTLPLEERLAFSTLELEPTQFETLVPRIQEELEEERRILEGGDA